MRLTYEGDAKKAVEKWAKKREIDEPECVRRLLRAALSRQGGAARWEEAGGPLARFSVRKALKSIDWDADKAAVDKVLQQGLDAYMEARGLQKSEAVSRLLISGGRRFQALDNFEKRPKTNDGRVKGARKTKGANKVGWLSRHERRLQAAKRKRSAPKGAAKSVEKAKVARKHAPRPLKKAASKPAVVQEAAE